MMTSKTYFKKTFFMSTPLFFDGEMFYIYRKREYKYFFILLIAIYVIMLNDSFVPTHSFDNVVVNKYRNIDRIR